MLIRAINNLDQQANYSALSNTEAAAATSLRIKNINGYSASWAVQVGKTGEEQSEIKVLGTATPSGTALTITTGLTYEHPQDTPVFSIKFDQIVFKRSTTGTAGTATALSGGTVYITPDSLFTVFDDTTGASTYAYKAAFRNSVTAEVSSDSDWITPDGFSFFSLAKLRQRIKSKLSNAGYIKDDETIDDWINEWKEELENAAIKVNKDYSLGTVNVSFGTSGLGTITNQDYKQTRKLEVTYDGVNFGTSSKMDITDFDDNTSFVRNNPHHAYLGDNVFIVRPCDSAGTARLTYYKRSVPLVNDTDELPFSMRSYTKSFIDYGMGQALGADDKFTDADRYERKAMQGKANFLAEITPRDQTGVEYIEFTENVDHLNSFWSD